MYINGFIHYIKHEKRYSDHTIQSYQIDIEQFTAYLKHSFEITKPQKVQSSFIRSWLVSLIDSNVSNRSINRKISTLKSYYKYLLRNDLVQSNPMDKIISPKVSKKLPVFVEEKNINDFFDEFVFEDSYKGALDRMILELLYSTGMRLSELINLKQLDVDLANQHLKVTGKGNKQRIIPFGNNLSKSITRYISAKKFHGLNHNTPYFFVNEKGKQLYPKFVYRRVHHYLSNISTVKKKSPHILRHTFATHMLNHGAELNTIKELLGHSSLSATQVYTHNTIDQLKTIYKQAHPKA